MRYYFLLTSVMLFFVLSIIACYDRTIFYNEDWEQEIAAEDLEIIKAAKEIINNTQGEVSLLDMHKTFREKHTRSINSYSQTLKNGHFILNWEQYHFLAEKDGEVLIVPIKQQKPMAIWRYSVFKNKSRTEQTPAYSILYLKRFYRSKNTICRILTYAPSRKYLKKEMTQHRDWYDPSQTDYSGLFMVSSLDGILLHGIQFENGHHKFRFRPNTTKTNSTRTDNTIFHQNHTPKSIQQTDSCASFFNMKMVTNASSTRTYSSDDETFENEGCIFCGGDPYTCDCFTVDVCKECGEAVEECVCNAFCVICNSWICTCETFCPDCESSVCICAVGGGNSEDTSEGGGIGGGGSTNNPPSTTTVFSTAKITQAAKNSVAKVIEKFGREKAYCNKGVDYAFQELTGSTELSNFNANNMVRHWVSSSNWTKINMADAQSKANEGYFTVAGWINTKLRDNGTEESGHVVVIVPGEMKESARWGAKLPVAMDTGSGMRTTSQPLNYSFGYGKRNEILFFIYHK